MLIGAGLPLVTDYMLKHERPVLRLGLAMPQLMASIAAHVVVLGFIAWIISWALALMFGAFVVWLALTRADGGNGGYVSTPNPGMPVYDPEVELMPDREYFCLDAPSMSLHQK